MNNFNVQLQLTTQDPITASYLNAGDYAMTSSWADNSVTASYVAATGVDGIVTTSATASTANAISFIPTAALSASWVSSSTYIKNADSASYYNGSVTSASYANSASYAPSNGGGINGMAYFTASTTWSVPVGVTNVRVIVIGSGGGGGSSLGGGGGGYSEGVVSVAGWTQTPVFVGASPGFNTNGNNSAFLSITGSGGTKGNSGGAGGNASGGSINIPGQSSAPFGGQFGGWPGTLPWNSPILMYTGTGTPFTGSIGWGGDNSNSSPTGYGKPGVVVLYY